MESANNQSPQQETPKLTELERENQMVFETREKVKEILESLLDNKEDLEEASQKFLICMNNGNTEEAVRLARDMAMQAELKDDLKKINNYANYFNADDISLHSEYNRALTDPRVANNLPTRDSINELMSRYTNRQDSMTSNRYLRKLVELKNTVTPFWEAYANATKKN